MCGRDIAREREFEQDVGRGQSGDRARGRAVGAPCRPGHRALDQRRRTAGLRQDDRDAIPGPGAGRRHLGRRPRHHPTPRPAPLLPRRARGGDRTVGLARGRPAARPGGAVPVAGRRRRGHRRVRRRRRRDDGGDLRGPSAHHVHLAPPGAGAPRGPARPVPDAGSARAPRGTGGRPVLPLRGRGGWTTRRPRRVRRGRATAAARQRRPSTADRADGRPERPGGHEQRGADRFPLGGRAGVVRAPGRRPATLLPPALHAWPSR